MVLKPKPVGPGRLEPATAGLQEPLGHRRRKEDAAGGGLMAESPPLSAFPSARADESIPIIVHSSLESPSCSPCGTLNSDRSPASGTNRGLSLDGLRNNPGLLANFMGGGVIPDTFSTGSSSRRMPPDSFLGASFTGIGRSSDYMPSQMEALPGNWNARGRGGSGGGSPSARLSEDVRLDLLPHAPLPVIKTLTKVNNASMVSGHEEERRSDIELLSMARTMIMQPLSTTLVHDSLQRGTPPCSILAHWGKQLRMTSGGIGAAGSKADDELYAMSRQVPVIDGFLSHSWHGSWLLKYLVLLFHFNSWPAAAVLLTCGLVMSLSETEAELLLGNSTQPWMMWTNFTVGDGSQSCPATAQYRFFAMPFGMLLWLFVLFNWHWVPKWCPRLGPFIFFDKVCIHQTQPELKEAGIKSIGGILQNSQELLLAWDSSYFQRLWCTYELSAFLHKKHKLRDDSHDAQMPRQRPRIIVIPVQLGGVVFAVLLGNTFVCVFAWMQAVSNEFMPYSVRFDPYGSAGDNPWGFIAWELVRLCPLMIAARWVRKYLRHFAKMDKQITSFRVNAAKCFCCTVNHINPENGQRMSCDRILVEDGIANLFSSNVNRSKQQALAEFETDVRYNVRRAMKFSLGKKSHIPYKFAVLLGIPFFLSELDFVSSFQNHEMLGQDEAMLKTLYAIHVLLLQWPFGWFVFQSVISWGVERKKWRIINRLIFVMLGITAMVTWLCLELTSLVALKCGKIYWVASTVSPIAVRLVWLSFEAAVVIYVYKPPWIRRVCPSCPKWLKWGKVGKQETGSAEAIVADGTGSSTFNHMNHRRQMVQDVFPEMGELRFQRGMSTRGSGLGGTEEGAGVEIGSIKPRAVGAGVARGTPLLPGTAASEGLRGKSPRPKVADGRGQAGHPSNWGRSQGDE